LSALPEDSRVRGSERYFLVDALGLDFMRNTYIAEYQREETFVSVFLARQDSPEAARDIVSRYVEYATQYGDGVKEVSVEGVDLTTCDMGGSYDVVFQKGRLVAGVSAVGDQDVAIEASVELHQKLQDN
jgi:hypothetical protein